MKQKSIILFLCLMAALGGKAQTSSKEVTLKTTAGDIRILEVIVPEEPKVEPKQPAKPSRPAKKRPKIK